MFLNVTECTFAIKLPFLLFSVGAISVRTPMVKNSGDSISSERLGKSQVRGTGNHPVTLAEPAITESWQYFCFCKEGNIALDFHENGG